jgi:hypothetical protein
MRRLVDGGRLLEHLEQFGEEPLGGSFPAIASEEGFLPSAGDLIDEVGLRLRGMVLPEFGPGVGLGGELLRQAEGPVVCVGGEHGAAGEVDADTDHLLGRRPGLRQGFGDTVGEGFEPVARMLERPVHP